MVLKASRHFDVWVQKRSVSFLRISRSLLVIFRKYIQTSLLSHSELSYLQYEPGRPRPRTRRRLLSFPEPRGPSKKLSCLLARVPKVGILVLCLLSKHWIDDFDNCLIVSR